MKIKLNSTQVVVEVEVRVELGKKKTVKTTSKVHPNYEEGGQKKFEKLKFLL